MAAETGQCVVVEALELTYSAEAPMRQWIGWVPELASWPHPDHDLNDGTAKVLRESVAEGRHPIRIHFDWRSASRGAWAWDRAWDWAWDGAWDGAGDRAWDWAWGRARGSRIEAPGRALRGRFRPAATPRGTTTRVDTEVPALRFQRVLDSTTRLTRLRGIEAPRRVRRASWTPAATPRLATSLVDAHEAAICPARIRCVAT